MKFLHSVIILLPTVVLILLMSIGRLSTWWLRRRFVGSFVIVVGIILVRALLYFGLTGSAKVVEVGDESPLVSLVWMPVLMLGLLELIAMTSIAEFLGLLVNSPSDNLGPFAACVSDFILLFPIFVTIQLIRDLNAKPRRVSKTLPIEPSPKE